MAPPLAAQLKTEDGVLDVQVRFDLKRERIHVGVFERIAEPFAVTHEYFDFHGSPPSTVIIH